MWSGGGGGGGCCRKTVPEKNPYQPREIPRRGGGGLQAKILEAKYEAKLEFPGGRGVQSKNLPWGENEYFLELHILDMFFTFKRINILLDYWLNIIRK